MAASFYKWLIILPSFLFMNQNPRPVSGIALLPGKTKFADSETYNEKRVHPFYVCVTEINHNAGDKTLEISCKIFADDFEKVLTQKYKSVVSLAHPKDKATLDKWINQYITGHLTIKTDGKTSQPAYLGFEKEEDAVFCYLQVDNVTAVKKIEVINTMLHDLNNNQINIMHVTVSGSRKSTKLDFPDSVAEFVF